MFKIITAAQKNGRTQLVAQEINLQLGLPSITAAIQLEQSGYEPPFIHFDEEQYPGLFRLVNNQNSVTGLVKELKAVNVIPARIRTWQNEFDGSYAVPGEISRLVRAGILQDTSWHNNTAPSFDHWNPREEAGFSLWVEHPSMDNRECRHGERFTVVRLVSEGEDGSYGMADDDQFMFATDSVSELEKWIGEKVNMLKVGQRVEFVKEWDIYPITSVRVGATGTVASIDADMVSIKLDEHDVALNEWENRILFTADNLRDYQTSRADAEFNPRHFTVVGDVVRWHTKVIEEPVVVETK